MPAYPQPLPQPSGPVTPWLAPRTANTTPNVPPIPVQWTLPSHPSSVRRARNLVTDLLPEQHRDHLAPDLTVITSELVTNALRHGLGLGIDVVFWPADGHYWLAVTDTAPELPTLGPAPGPGSTHGRGLHLVNDLAAAWAVVPRRFAGKSVVAGVRLPTA